MAVWFRLLGGIEAEADGVPLDLGSAKQRAVLAVLLVEADRLVPADRVVDRVWGERAPARARNSLHTYVSGLRAALSGSAVELIGRSGGYRLVVDELRVDVHLFRDLVTRARAADDERAAALFEQALGLWRGEPVANLDTPWAVELRTALERERLAAELDRADTGLRRGRHAELLPGLADRAQRYPLDERVAAQFMLALYRSDRPADAVEHYHQVRTRLVDELGTDPGPRLQDLYHRVLNADPDLTPATSVPRQLPATPRLFTGRAHELATLTAALDSATGTAVVISALTGAGGIGKTWLALHWAHHHHDRFPDGQLFVDLRGFSSNGPPMASADALRGFLDALGVTAERIPTDLDAQAALYRSLLADRRVLVVLDNAATADQVVPLLPGSPSCTALVTSRNRLPALVARHSARTLPLDVLTDTEAHALLTASLEPDTADEDAIAELVALCGGFPLALSLIAARVQHLTPAEAVAELRESGLDALDDDDPAASLPTVLSWSLRPLTDEQRQVFALLGIAPGPDIDLPAAASLVGLPEAQTRKALRALEDHSLLLRHPHGRYAMHDLVRAYAATTAHDHLTEPVRRAALERVVDHYLHTAHTADHLLDPHRAPIRLDPPAADAHPRPLADQQAALAWLDTHHPHLLAAQHTAAAGRRHRTVWHLAWTLHVFHRRRGHRHDRLAVWQAAAEAADQLDPATRAHARRFLGQAHAVLEQHEEAIENLHQALALAELHHDATQQARIHQAIARAWEVQGDDHRALKHVRHALDLYRTLDEPVREADTLNGVGWFAARVGDYDTARAHCLAALVLSREHQDANGEAYTLDSLGYIDHHSGRHDQAVVHYRQALALFRALGNTTEAANTLHKLGHPHAALGQHAEARAAWEEALGLYRDQGRETAAQRVRRQLDDLDPPG
ncbi:tetratricopeptide repeat protein [Saccharothrix sp. SC076]|nr:tetratricopeptide repeat protein [Saccharothrix obliqua]